MDCSKKTLMIVTKVINAQNNRNRSAFLSCFSNDATVCVDETDYEGLDNIEQWFAEAISSYTGLQFEIEGIDDNEDRAVATINIVGDFPGSPIVLSYQMEFDRGRVNYLRIE